MLVRSAIGSRKQCKRIAAKWHNTEKERRTSIPKINTNLKRMAVNWIALKIARLCLRIAFSLFCDYFFVPFSTSFSSEFFFSFLCLCRNTIKQFINSFVCHFAIFVPGLVLLADFLVPNTTFRTSSSDCSWANIHGEFDWIRVIGAHVPYILRTIEIQLKFIKWNVYWNCRSTATLSDSAIDSNIQDQR